MSIGSIVPIVVILTVGPIAAFVAIPEAAAIALIGSIAIAALVLMTRFMGSLRTIIIAALAAALFREARLFAVELARPDRGRITGTFKSFVRLVGPVAALRALRRKIAVVARIRATLADLLLTVGHDDAIVVLGVLEVIFGKDRIA